MKKLLAGIFTLLLMVSALSAQKIKTFEVKSPDGNLVITVTSGKKIQWSVRHKEQQIISPSPVSLILSDGSILGDNAKIRSDKSLKRESSIKAINYVKSEVKDNCTELILSCKGDYTLIFRAYDDAAAYRFTSSLKGEITVVNEEANFNFTEDHKAFIPYMWDYRSGKIFNTSFESLYKEINISQFAADSLAFLPLLVDLGNGRKAVITEADLEDYPGMYVNLNDTKKGFKGVYAPYPLETSGGENRIRNLIPVKRADYIAKTNGTRSFPWRVVVISENDKDLLDNDVVVRLASAPRISDWSWVKPGQAAWDWWNDWNISHVDFRAGINTPTYKYYIDFASANNIKYIILDEGWSDTFDLLKINKNINLEELVAYGRSKNVDIILWASWAAVLKQMDTVFPKYAEMGIKGFKIDFIDRDDQVAVASTYEMAKKAADCKLMVDYHGIFKPTGLQHTYPNVIGYEGVMGLENYKWAVQDQPRYCVSIPFIRMMAGPMDYTPGAMRNANRYLYHPQNSNPMSMGTRCNQLAMYIMYYAPFQMLADNPTTYMKEQECTDFITSVPTVFEQTVALDGKVGEYAALARRHGTTWYAAAMTSWTPRDMTLDLSFLGEGMYRAVIFKDGINADREATDYKKEVITVSSKDRLNLKLYPGGGFAARFEKMN